MHKRILPDFFFLFNRNTNFLVCAGYLVKQEKKTLLKKTAH